jgi:hypothetical protein
MILRLGSYSKGLNRELLHLWQAAPDSRLCCPPLVPWCGWVVIREEHGTIFVVKGLKVWEGRQPGVRRCVFFAWSCDSLCRTEPSLGGVKAKGTHSSLHHTTNSPHQHSHARTQHAQHATRARNTHTHTHTHTVSSSSLITRNMHTHARTHARNMHARTHTHAHTRTHTVALPTLYQTAS